MTSSLKATKSEYDNESRRSAIASLPSNEELIAKCLSLGLVMRRPPHYSVSHPTIALQPTTIPAVTYHRLLETQELWNEAVDNIARNYQFLKDSLTETATSDSEFTGNLLTILEEVYLPDPASSSTDTYAYQKAMLGIFRTDYMKHAPAALESTETAATEKTKAAVADDATTTAGASSPSAKKSTVVKKKTAKPSGVGAASRLLDKVAKKLASPKASASDSGNGGAAPPTVTNADEDAATWKNVEINTISVSFAGLSPMVGRFLNYLAHRNDCLLASQTAAVKTQHGQVVISDSDIKVPAGLYAATKYWSSDVPLAAFTEEYAKTHNGVRLQPVVVVVIQENERNTGDQYRLLFNLLDNSNVVAIRRTYSDLAENGHHSFNLVDFPGAANNNSSGSLKAPPFAVIEEAYVASVFFFRSSYVPEDFPAPSAWKLRTEMERSNAIKCPSIPHHLMTFKKMQQLMCDIDNVLAPIAFKGDRAKAERLAKHFMAQYSLNPHEKDNAENAEQVIAEAIAHPERFVLKPQLEGGGNLIAGEEMQKALSVTLSDDPHQAKMYWKVRKEYILMRRIAFPRKTGSILRDGVRHTLESNLCSELGIYGVILSTGETVTASAFSEAAAPTPVPASAPARAPPTKSRPASAPSPKTPVKMSNKSAASAGGTLTEKKTTKSNSLAGATPPEKKSEVTRFLLNEAAGYVVRSKPADVDDGGVMAGVAALDGLQFLS